MPLSCMANLSFLVLQVEAPTLLQQVGSLLVRMGQDQRSWFKNLDWIELIKLPVFLSSSGRMSFIPNEAMAYHNFF